MSAERKNPGGKSAGSWRRGSEATANAVYRAADVVARQDDRVANGTQAVTGAIGTGLQGAGLGLSGVGQKASKVLHGNANRAADAARQAVVGTGQAGGLRKAAGALTWMEVNGSGGITLGQAWRDRDNVPANVEEAFALAYPVMAQTMSFSEAVGRTSSDGLVGLVSEVKGKLFEVELLEHLNSGGLPDGFHAELAASATQRGWNIRVLDENGQVSELLQAKATEKGLNESWTLESYGSINH